MKNIFLFLLVLFLFSCTIPPKKLSTSVVVPRGVILDSQQFTIEENKTHTPFQLGFGIGKGESFSDNGSIQFGSLLDGNFEVHPLSFWAIGLRPYVAMSDRATTDRSHFGIELYQRWKVVGTKNLRLSFFNSFRFAENKDTDTESFCFIFCTPTEAEGSTAHVKLMEVSLSPLFEIALNSRNLIALAPELLWRKLETENRHPTLGSHAYRQILFDYSVGVLYGFRFGAEENILLQVGGGYKKRTGFGETEKQIKDGMYLSAHLRFH